MANVLVSLLGLTITPILIFLAWRTWKKSLQRELGHVRNSTCLSALLLLSAQWIAIAALFAAQLTREGPLTDLMTIMFSVFRVWALISIGLTFALKGIPRLQAVSAGLLMLFCWPASYI